MELVHSNPRILDAVMRSLGALIRRLTEQNADHVFLDLPGRVAKTLVRLAGESQAPMITIELNQSQLAEMAGGSRQSVNQAIGSFASRGWLRTEGRRIVVTDVAALRRRAGCPTAERGPPSRPPQRRRQSAAAASVRPSSRRLGSASAAPSAPPIALASLTMPFCLKLGQGGGIDVDRRPPRRGSCRSRRSTPLGQLDTCTMVASLR